MLATLLRPTGGTATVFGHDILEEPDAVRRSIGYVFQDPTLDLELTGRENLDLHGRLYGVKRDVRQQRIKEMLELVQLTDRADDFVKTYSGGMKRRLEIARGLLHHPQVLFLDEPTLGLDPQTRRSIWEHIQSLNETKKVTIILTTHYTEEADYLCERILIIDFGKIVALDTPRNLKDRLEGDVVSLTFADSFAVIKVRPLLEKKEWVRRINTVGSSNNYATMGRVMQMMRETPLGEGMVGMGAMDGMMPRMSTANVEPTGKTPNGVQQRVAKGVLGSKGPDEGSRWLNLLVDDGGHRIPEIVKLVNEAGVILESVELHKPTLDDVFLSVTGRNIRDEQGSMLEMIRRRHILQQARGGR
jgi:ABC-type multidrug transport system ATPase subunit